MPVQNVTLQVISDGQFDTKRIDELTRSLLIELKNLDVKSACLQKSGTLPHGAKAGDPVTIGAIFLTVLSTSLPVLIGFIQSWVLRGDHKRVKVKVGETELEFTSKDQLTQQEILELVTSLKS